MAAPTPLAPLTAEELRALVAAPGATFNLYGSLNEDQVERTLDPAPSTPRLVIAVSCSAATPTRGIMVTVKATQGGNQLTTLAVPCGDDTSRKLATMEPASFTPAGEPVVLEVSRAAEPSLRYTVAVLGT